MINLKKNDAVAESIKAIMEKELSDKQKRIAALAGDKKSIDALDLAALRAGKKPTSEEAEPVEENAFDYKSPRQPEPNGGSGVKKGTRYGGSKQKEKPEQEEPKEKNEEASYFKQRLLEKNWIAGAIKHPGALTRAAKKAGESTSEYEEKHKHDSGVAGKRSRLAITLKGLKKEETEQVDEGMKDALKKMGQKTFKALTGGSDEDQLKALQKRAGAPVTGKKPVQKEEVESLDEGKMDKMTLSGLWHKHAQHSHWNDQGYGSGTDSPRHSGHAATAIENHVRKHHGNKVADDMVSHSDHHVAYHEYAGPEEASHHEKEMAKLKKKHGISDKDLHESAPPGFEGTVKSMKKHKDITNPFALAWSMKNKGYKSHKKADGSDK